MSCHQEVRCFVAPELWCTEPVALAPEESHYLLQVLRLKTGAALVAFDGLGRRAPARLAAVQSGRAYLALNLAAAQISQPPAVKIVLAQALPKHQLMDEIIQKAVELGVWEIIPMLSAHVVARVPERQLPGKLERWRKIARESARQCGADYVPAIHKVCVPSELCRSIADCRVCFLGSLAPSAVLWRKAVEQARPLSLGAKIMLIIGPEGDFSPEEHDLFTAAGAVPVSFGRRVLRVATAALFGVSVLRYEFAEAADSAPAS